MVKPEIETTIEPTSTVQKTPKFRDIWAVHHTIENPFERINALATKLELPLLTEAYVEALHGLLSRSDEENANNDSASSQNEVRESSKNAAPVLVRFVSRSTRDAGLTKTTAKAIQFSLTGAK